MALPAPGAPLGLLAEAAAAGFGCIVHSVFGVAGSFAALQARAAADPALRAALQARGGAGDPDAALGRLLLERAFAGNPGGVVLVSMFSAASRAQNLPVAALPPGAGALAARRAARPDQARRRVAPAPVGARLPDRRPRAAPPRRSAGGRSAGPACRR